jgi:hypothetical protein
MAETKEWGWIIEHDGKTYVQPVEGATCTADVERDVRNDIKKHGEGSAHMEDGAVTKVYAVQKVLEPKITRKIVQVDL